MWGQVISWNLQVIQMPYRLVLTWMFLIAISFPVSAQALWDLKDPGKQFNVKCGACKAVLRAKPREVQFAVYADKDNVVWFLITDGRFLDELLHKEGDGIAVDVILRSEYTCGGVAPRTTGYPKGTLLEPVYKAELERTKVTLKNGHVKMKAGTLSSAMAAEDHELTLLIIQDRNICHTNYFYNLQVYRWDLLNMGLYMDTLTYATRSDTANAEQGKGSVRRKTMHFTIPFEKNKAVYSPADLQPLYDSLRLTDFTIKRIDINAYSSVEGPEQRNIELQESRAQSIVKALQSFQTRNIVTSVKASENWVEFLSDISRSPYPQFAALAKVEIKRRLAEEPYSEDLEPILSKHRKAVIILELHRKDGNEAMTDDQLQKAFKKALTDKNMAYAQQLQNTAFTRILDKDVPSTFLAGMEVPLQREYADLLNSREAFNYLEGKTAASQTYLALLDLDRSQPNNGHINYNLCVLQFQLLIMGDKTVDPLELKRRIGKLRGMGIAGPLEMRMLINHNIIMAEADMLKGDYSKKDERLAFIRSNYEAVPMRNKDHLSLAQYFASYANFSDAMNILEPHLADIDVDEDLLFYYLNLTIFDPEQTKKSGYRSTMLNAANKNKPRYCSLFDAFDKGGITFQLLDDPYLRKTYCETCN